MLVGSVKNASLSQKFTLNLISFRVCDLSGPIRCHSRGSGWGLVSSVIWPFFLMFSVKMGKILMLSV